MVSPTNSEWLDPAPPSAPEEFPTPRDDPEEFPTMRALSAGLLFFRRVAVYQGAPLPLEFISFQMPRGCSCDEEGANVLWKVTEWNAQWEAGPYRTCDTDDLPPTLSFLRDLEAVGTAPTSDIVLIPREHDNIYHRWAPLYHLLSHRSLVSAGLPLIHRGIWPVMGAAWGHTLIRPSQSGALERAVAQHLWSHGLGKAKAPLAAFSKNDSLRLLCHDLSFWRSHFESLMRKYGNQRGRIKRDEGDIEPESFASTHPDLRFEMPRLGTELWTGEAEASEVTRDLIELADQRGRLRSVMDAIRSNRVEEDFSKRWSSEREDFERKLYRKRNRVKVSFVEFDDSIPYLDDDSQVEVERRLVA